MLELSRGVLSRVVFFFLFFFALLPAASGNRRMPKLRFERKLSWGWVSCDDLAQAGVNLQPWAYF